MFVGVLEFVRVYVCELVIITPTTDQRRPQACALTPGRPGCVCVCVCVCVSYGTFSGLRRNNSNNSSSSTHNNRRTHSCPCMPPRRNFTYTNTCPHVHTCPHTHSHTLIGPNLGVWEDWRSVLAHTMASEPTTFDVVIPQEWISISTDMHSHATVHLRTGNMYV